MRIILILLSLVIFHPRAVADCPSLPTGWVDRIEGEWVVVELEQDDEEGDYPLVCFPGPVSEGDRIVAGVVDPQATEAMRAQIDEILARQLSPPQSLEEGRQRIAQ
jgi:Protein of unknown function (DUF3006)